MVTPTPGGKVPTGDTQLTINASLIHDAEGRELDGNDDGQPRGNYVATLNNQGVISAVISTARTRRISARAVDALLLDGHFDVKTDLCDLRLDSVQSIQDIPGEEVVPPMALLSIEVFVNSVDHRAFARLQSILDEP